MHKNLVAAPSYSEVDYKDYDYDYDYWEGQSFIRY